MRSVLFDDTEVAQETIAVTPRSMAGFGRRDGRTTTATELDAMMLEAARRPTNGVLFNPAAVLYAGLTLRDCLRGVDLPCSEILITTIGRRGMDSVTAEASLGYVVGSVSIHYLVALAAMLRHLGRRT